MFSAGIPYRSLAFAVFGCAIVSCIDRSNPFDPLNAGGRAGANIRAEKQARLDSLSAGEAAYAAQIGAYESLVKADSTANAARALANAGVRAANAAKVAANATVEKFNAAAPVDSLRYKAGFDPLDTLKAYGPYPDFQTRRNAVRVQTANLARFMSDVNAEHSPTLPYPPDYADSVLGPFAKDTLGFFLLQARIDKGNAATADSNAAVRAYDVLRVADNAVVQGYNDSIDFLKRGQNKNIITSPDSLRGTTFVAKAGDSLLIGAGEYPVDLRFTNNGTPDSPIVVRGYPGLRTILKPQRDKTTGALSSSAAILSGRAYIRFEDIVFRGCPISGIKLESFCHGISFRRCQFDSCGQFGIEVIDSDVDMLDCRIIANAGGAKMQGQIDRDLRIHFQNVLVAGNKGHGLECNLPKGEILNSTIAFNGGEGIRVNSPRLLLTIGNTIVANNGGYGIYRDAENGFQDNFQVKECDVWKNTQGDWYLKDLDTTRAVSLINANPPVDPEFIDPPRFDYGLRPGSVLAGYEKQAPRIIIGYRP